MRRSKEIIGLPVLSLASGKRISEVKDVLFDPQDNRFIGVLLREGGGPEDSMAIPFEQIRSVGRDAVIVQDESAVVTVASDEKIKAARERAKILAGISVYTEDGRYLGRIDDLYIDETTGNITGYDLSAGLIESALRGRVYLPAPENAVIGKDVIFVPSSTGTQIEEEAAGGFRETIEETRKRSEEAARRAAEELRRISEQMMKATTDRQKDFVVGKVAERTVTTSDGTVIVTAGDEITPQTADEAERRGVLTSLVALVGGTQARSTAERIGEEARLAFEQLRESFGVSSRSGTEWFRESRVRSALGRPVTRVILDEADNVILNTGDIVTYAAVARAREARVLDILLDSVSREEPRFGFETRRGSSTTVPTGEPTEGEPRIEH